MPFAFHHSEDPNMGLLTSSRTSIASRIMLASLGALAVASGTTAPNANGPSAPASSNVSAQTSRVSSRPSSSSQSTQSLRSERTARRDMLPSFLTDRSREYSPIWVGRVRPRSLKHRTLYLVRR